MRAVIITVNGNDLNAILILLLSPSVNQVNEVTVPCYRPQMMFGEGNVFTPVCLFRGGVMMSLPVMDSAHP